MHVDADGHADICHVRCTDRAVESAAGGIYGLGTAVVRCSSTSSPVAGAWLTSRRPTELPHL